METDTNKASIHDKVIDVPLQQGKAIIQMYENLNTQTRLTPNIGK